MPHSEIFGSKPVRGSPKLIAAYHVLLRLSAPRHPPDTLKALDCARNQKTDDIETKLSELGCSHKHPRPRVRPDATPSDPKRPVLLQTHPGTLRSSGAHDWLLRRKPARRTLQTIRISLAKSRNARCLRQTGCASSSQCQFHRNAQPEGSDRSEPAGGAFLEAQTFPPGRTVLARNPRASN